MSKFVDPLYLRVTNPRTTSDGNGVVPSAQTLFKGLSVSSQYKVSLFLQRTILRQDSLEQHLTKTGVFDENESSSYTYDFFASEAMLPGANFDITEQPGAMQGMLEYNATRRIFPDFEVTFYVDEKYNILRMFEEWMNYVNPLYDERGKYVGGYDGQQGFVDRNSYYRMRYPNNYKREIAITKFERIFVKNPNQSATNFNAQDLLTYKFIDAFPKQVTAVPLSYEGSTVLKVSVIFGYTRYITLKDNVKGNSKFGSEDHVGVMDSAIRKRRNKLIKAQDDYIEQKKTAIQASAIAEDFGMTIKDAATIAAGGFVETIFDVGSGDNKDEKANKQAENAFNLGDGAGFL